MSKGIKDQIEDSNKLNHYSSITEEKMKEIIKDFFYGDSLKESKIFQPIKELPQDFNLDSQIKDGYMYETHGSIKLATGSGGIRDIIKASREAGIPDIFIAQDIYVYDYETGNGGWIGDIKWTPITKDNGTI